MATKRDLAEQLATRYKAKGAGNTHSYWVKFFMSQTKAEILTQLQMA